MPHKTSWVTLTDAQCVRLAAHFSIDLTLSTHGSNAVTAAKSDIIALCKAAFQHGASSDLIQLTYKDADK